MPYARTGLRKEKRELREGMRATGLDYRQIASEFARVYKLRPRAAWREAYGWSLQDAADKINAYRGNVGLDPRGLSGMTSAHLSEYENWPGCGETSSGRKPTPYLLAVLAAIYDCQVSDLIDLADREHFLKADLLVIDTYSRPPVNGTAARLPYRARRLAELRRSRAWSPADLACELKKLRDGLPSVRSLAHMILMDWETGKHCPGPRYRLLLAAVFNVDERDIFGETAGTVAEPDDEERIILAARHPRRYYPEVVDAIPLHPAAADLMPDPDLLARITSALEDESRADLAIVSWLEICLAEHRRVEDTIGSGPLVDIIGSQLSTVVRFARQARSPLTERIVDLGAQYAQFMAWLAADQKNRAAALSWYDRSHDWAMEAGDANMAATTLSMKAHLAWSVGDSMRCVRLGEAARWNDDRTSPGVQGMAAQMIARGHAIGSDSDNAHRGIDQAQALIATAAEHPEDEPPWMYFYGETWFTAQRGMIETELAERGKGEPQYAVALLERALSDLPESYRRDRAWYGAMLARAHAAADNYDAAVGIGLRFAPDAVAVNKHAVDELKRLSATLNKRGVRQAFDLSDALSGGH
jgi:transcriptional regulator with XRE-family HTH domain